MRISASVLFCLACAGQASADVTLPPTYELQIVYDNLNKPSSMCFAPDDRVFISEIDGVIKIFKPNQSEPIIFADFRSEVYSQDGRGLLSIQIHPDFPNTPFVYALYTLDGPPGSIPPVYNDICENAYCVVGARLSRFTACEDVACGETIMAEGWCQQYSSHSIGDLHFGPDGNLYVSGGDGASFVFADFGQEGNPCSDPPNEGGALRSQDLLTMSDPVGLNGTILRIDPITGTAPLDNPLIGGDPSDDLIIAFGLRNPFRFMFKPNSTSIWICDVGWQTTEELNIIPDATDGLVENFGWPCYEGTSQQSGYASNPMCQSLYANPNVTYPVYAYEHGPSHVVGCEPLGASITGIAFCDVPEFGFEGYVFLCDSSRNCIWTHEILPNGLGPAQSFAGDYLTPIELQFGPDGNLYVISVYGGNIAKIIHRTGPVAQIDASMTFGSTPLNISFDASESTDPTQSALTYEWDWESDGIWDAIGVVSSHTFTTDGLYNVTLRVTNTQNQSDTAEIYVAAGNNAPQAIIDSPSPAHLWFVGEPLTVIGHGTDIEDGDLSASQITWSVDLLHCDETNPTQCHRHPYAGSSNSNSISFNCPDHEFPAALRIDMSVTDSGSGILPLTSTTTMIIYPMTNILTLDATYPDLLLTFNARTVTSPYIKEVIHGSTSSISAISPQNDLNYDYSFIGWSDFGPQTHNIVVTQNVVVTANYERFCRATATDLNDDGTVSISDLTILLSLFGSSDINADFNGNGAVDIGDLATMLSAFGANCN